MDIQVCPRLSQRQHAIQLDAAGPQPPPATRRNCLPLPGAGGAAAEGCRAGAAGCPADENQGEGRGWVLLLQWAKRQQQPHVTPELPPDSRPLAPQLHCRAPLSSCRRSWPGPGRRWTAGARWAVLCSSAAINHRRPWSACAEPPSPRPPFATSNPSLRHCPWPCPARRRLRGRAASWRMPSARFRCWSRSLRPSHTSPAPCWQTH